MGKIKKSSLPLWTHFELNVQSLEKSFLYNAYAEMDSYINMRGKSEGAFPQVRQNSVFLGFLKSNVLSKDIFFFSTVLAEIEFLHPLFIAQFACKMVVKAWVGGQVNSESMANLRSLVYI